jgi:Common central domain of tyrosinase
MTTHVGTFWARETPSPTRKILSFRAARAVVVLVVAICLASCSASEPGASDDSSLTTMDRQTCWPTGQRCIGAPGFPSVAWRPCCTQSDTCSPVLAPDWGYRCTARAVTTTCYATGQRCQGAAGFPFVNWRPCCMSGDRCVQTTAAGDWGFRCVSSTAGTNSSPSPSPSKSSIPNAVALSSPSPSPSPSPSRSPSPSPSPSRSPSPSPSPSSSNSGGTCTSGMRVRKEIMDLQVFEWNMYTYALNRMRSTQAENGLTIFENFVQFHAQNVLQAHQGSYFLPWHRQLLYEFETALRRFAPVTIPYWDWTKPIPGSSLLVNQKFSIDPVWARMGGASGGNIPSSPFLNWWTNIPSMHSVQRQFTVGSNTPYAFVSRANLDVLTRSRGGDFSTFSTYLEAVHGSPHVAVGGDMQIVTQSPNDPMFWSHHAFVDKIWSEWQLIGGNGNAFGGTHNNPIREVCLDCERMTPLQFGRTVRQILDGISTCVTYQETSTRIPPIARLLIDSFVRETRNSSDPGAMKLETKSQKEQLLSIIADSKVDNPSKYRLRVLNATKVRDTCITSTSFSNLPHAMVASALKSFDTIQLLLHVNINDSSTIGHMSNEEIIQEGRYEKRVLASGNLPPKSNCVSDVKNAYA